MLTIDTDAGVVTGHEPPVDTRERIGFDERLQQMKDEKERAADKMDEAFRREQSRDRLMEDKFRELMEKAKDIDDSKPIRDIDLD
ncbi:MAG: hypothetical protein GY906_17520 [bacterium]|nr:hypothetical protein [bacterium]